jgi:hypothetical protein
MILRLHVPEAEPYLIDDDQDLRKAIETEADAAASEADNRHLATGDEAERDEFRVRVVDEATEALRAPGDSYRDPIGVLWTLEAQT